MADESSGASKREAHGVSQRVFHYRVIATEGAHELEAFMQATLDELGLEGWELASIVDKESTWVWIFKREKR